MDKKTLARRIEEASAAYYNSGNPIMEDAEYDALVEALAAIDPAHPLLQKVGSRPMGVVFKHNIPAGSQEKLKDKAAFDRWISQTQEFGCRGYVIGYKLDGLTIVLDYQNGRLIRALTRGDGFEGEDITANVIQMKNVKQVLPLAFTGAVRAEMILSKSDFETYFKPLGYTNPRNSAAGVSRDQKGTGLCRHLQLIYFDMVGNDGCQTETDNLRYMHADLGLAVVETEFYATAGELWAAWQAMAAIRDGLDYEIDGVVVRANSIDVQKAMGMTADLRPKGQKCLKFEAQGAITEVKAVELTIGSTGAIVPTAQLAPVGIGGVTVSAALLANFDEVKRLDVAVGDTVYVTRRGDVIPKIEHVVSRPAHRQPILPPDTCIVCGAPTEAVGAYLLCTNDGCVGTEFRRLLKYVTKRGIKYLGEGTLAELYENHGVKTPPDLYSLTEETLRNMTRGNGSVVGEGAVAIMDEIGKSRTVQLKDLLGCLSIPLLGRRQAEIMIQQGVDTLEKFLTITVDELVKLQGFKETKATTIAEGIKAARPLIDSMSRILTLEAPKEEKPMAMVGNKLAGKLFCFTGKIEKVDETGNHYTRDMMHQTVLQNGGSVTDKVTKDTTLVQANPTSKSSKTQKAEKVGATIMSEADFWKLVA